MTYRWHSIVLFVGVAATANAGWSGFPVSTNASFYSISTNHYWKQLYSGLVERCLVAGASHPKQVDTWTVYAGATNWTFVTNSMTLTNWYPITTNITVTNIFEPFEYTYVDPITSDTITATGYPTAKVSWFTNWDAKFTAILTSFIPTNMVATNAAGTNFNDWFVMQGVSNLGTSATPPTWTKTNLFATLEIGFTNSNSVAQFTYAPAETMNEWLMAAIWATGVTSTAWTFKAFSDMGTNMHPANATARPVARYILGGTSETVSLSMILTGKVWQSSGTGIVSAGETVVFSDTNDVTLANCWASITGITCTNSRANSNDAVRIMYSDVPSLFSQSVPYRLYAVALNERWQALDTLRWTYSRTSKYEFSATNWINEFVFSGGWTAATAAAEAKYPTNEGLSSVWGTCGTYGEEYWTVVGGVSVHRYSAFIENLSPWTCSNTIPYSGFSVGVDFYWYAQHIQYVGYDTNQIFDAQGTALRKDCFTLIGSTLTNGTKADLPTPIGTTNRPAWCREPNNTKPSLGYNAHRNLTNMGITVWKWDVTNGMTYVR